MKDDFKLLTSFSTFANFLALKLCTLLLALFLFLIVPLLLIVSIPLFITRYFVGAWAKYLKPGLGKMVTCRGNIYTTDDLFNKPQCNVVVGLTLERNMDLRSTMENARINLLNSRFPNGELKYPELKQYLTTWAGYHFWKDDEAFDLKNHVKFHESKSNELFDNDAIQEIRQELVTRKWVEKRALWEIILIPNYYPKGDEHPGPYTAVFLRFHHSLGDGYSWLSLIIEGMCQQPIKNALPTYFKREICAMILYIVTFPFRGAYTGAEMIMMSFQKLPFRITSKIRTRDINGFVSDRIPVCKLKTIKDYFRVSFSSVVFAVLAGATREMLIKKRMDIPTTFPAITFLPIPGHSTKLRNYMTGAVAKLPTGLGDPIARLTSSSNDYNRIKRSTAPTLIVYNLMILGSYFSWITKIVGKQYITSSFLSNFPAGLEYMSVNGHKIVDCMFTTGLQGGCTGLGFTALSYVDGMRISVITNAAVMTKEEVQEMTGLIVKHIDILYQLVISEV